MSKKINNPAPVTLYFSATIKTTELILELGRWKSAYQLLHTNFISLTLTAQDAILHLAKYLSLIMQIAPLVSIIQNVCRISPNKMYLFACIWSYFSLEQLSAVYQRGVGKNFVSNANSYYHCWKDIPRRRIYLKIYLYGSWKYKYCMDRQCLT